MKLIHQSIINHLNSHRKLNILIGIISFIDKDISKMYKKIQTINSN